LLFILAALLLYPAFFNGYPYVYSDTGTYIRSGFVYEVPNDRPIFYGLFIHHTSMGASLWLTLAGQALLMVSCLVLLQQLLLRKLFPDVRIQQILALITLFVLTRFSSLPFNTSMLLPDVFTAVPLLILLVMLLKPSITILQYAVLLAVYTFFTFTHLSNLLSLTIVLPCILLAKAIFRPAYISYRRIAILGGFTLFMWVLAPAINSLFHYGFKMSKSSHVFTMATFIDNGLLKEYLDNDPEARQYSLYQYRDSLPSFSGEFLWDYNKSPLYKTGGWDNSKDEYNAIISDIIFSRDYFFRWAKGCFTATLRQLTQNDFGVELTIPYNEPDSPPRISVASHFPDELFEYDHSRQNKGYGGFDFNKLSSTQNLLIIAGLFLIIFYLLKYGLSSPVLFASATAIIYIMANALVVASLSAVGDRYNSRVSWVIIFFAMNIIFVYQSDRVKKMAGK
jgi:hypothetical protein